MHEQCQLLLCGGFVLYSKTCACQVLCSYFTFTVPLSSLFFALLFLPFDLKNYQNFSLKTSPLSPLSHLSRWLILNLLPLAPLFHWKTKTIGGYLIGLGLHGYWGKWVETAKTFYLFIHLHGNQWALSLRHTPTVHAHFFLTTGILPTIWVSCRSVKAETGRGVESHWCNKHCHLHNSNDIIRRLKIKDYYSSENPQSQKYYCETWLEHFVSLEWQRDRLAAVKFYRAYLSIQYRPYAFVSH